MGRGRDSGLQGELPDRQLAAFYAFSFFFPLLLRLLLLLLPDQIELFVIRQARMKAM